jgi:predicted nuclease of restriction endonuclease-like (RecB) superfamily
VKRFALVVLPLAVQSLAVRDRELRSQEPGYADILADVARLVEDARRAAARSINTVMTSTYWQIGRCIVEREQAGAPRAGYGDALLQRLSADLTKRFGRGFSIDRLETARLFYRAYPPIGSSDNQPLNSATASRNLPTKKSATLSRKSTRPPAATTPEFRLSWSHYVLLIRRVDPGLPRRFYETEALRGGWTLRQMERQIESQFYERTALSRNKAVMLTKGAQSRPEDAVAPEEEIKDPFVLEFLGLKDEYSESELEEALISKLETFLLELGGDFAFIGRQRRLRIGSVWYRVDLLFFHRRLRCLVVVDLKIGRFTHADAGQMHLYLNYAREHWTVPGENPPVGLILCRSKEDAVVKYVLEGLSNKVLATEYRTTLPDEKVLEHEFEKSRRLLESRRPTKTARRREPPPSRGSGSR